MSFWNKLFGGATGSTKAKPAAPAVSSSPQAKPVPPAVPSSPQVKPVVAPATSSSQVKPVASVGAGSSASPAVEPKSTAIVDAAHAGLELPKELGPDSGKVHLNAVFADYARDQLLAMCQAMPIEKLDFRRPASSDLMNRAVSVSLLMVRYLAAKDKPQEYGDVLIPRFLAQLERHSPESIHQQVAVILEQFGGELSSGGREREALRCFTVLSKTPFGKTVAPRVSGYVFALHYNIALKSKRREDIEVAMQAFDSLPPSEREPFSNALPKLTSLLPNLPEVPISAAVVRTNTNVKGDLVTAVKGFRDKNVPRAEAASQLKASGQFDLEVFKEVILDESVQISARQIAMFIGASSGDPEFMMFLAKEFVLNKNPKLMIDNPKYGSLGMFSDAKDICEKHGFRFN